MLDDLPEIQNEKAVLGILTGALVNVFTVLGQANAVEAARLMADTRRMLSPILGERRLEYSDKLIIDRIFGIVDEAIQQTRNRMN